MKALKHFKTITHHRHLVIKHGIKVGLFPSVLGHDLSKYSFAEFIPSVKYYQGTKSPTEAERLENGYSKAWLHHKGRNKHHFEYWTDIDPKTQMYAPVKMPIRYVKEMLCDRLAACKTYLKDKYNDSSAYDYFMSHKSRDFMHEETSKLIESWLKMIKDKGEKETFKYLKGISNNANY